MLFIDGPVAIYLYDGSPGEVNDAFERLQKVVNLAARLRESHVEKGGESHVSLPTSPAPPEPWVRPENDPWLQPRP